MKITEDRGQLSFIEFSLCLVEWICSESVAAPKKAVSISLYIVPEILDLIHDNGILEAKKYELILSICIKTI